MANTIRIPRSVSTNTPAALAQGELAFSESGSPNGIGELFIGVSGPGVQKIATLTGAAAAEPNSSAQDNQTITTGTGIDGADAGDAGNITLSLALDELSVGVPVTGDWLAFDNAGVSEKALISAIDLGIFNNDQGWTSNAGIVTSIGDGVGTIVTGTGAVPIISVDYVGVDNFIDAATNLESTAIDSADTIVYHDATDNNVKKGLVSDLPFGSGSGDISRVDITAGIGLVGDLNTVTGDHIQTIDMDFTTLTDMTATVAGTTEIILNDAGTESRKAISEIALSFFNNDSGWAPGTVTAVTGGIGVDSTGGTTPEITLDLSELTVATMVTGDWIAFDDAGATRKALIGTIPLSIFNNDSGWEANDADTVLTTDTGSATWNWILDEDAMGTDSDAHVPTQQSVKAYVDNAVSGGLTHKGSYNATTNSPALDTGSPVLVVGDMYTVTVAGTFFTIELEVGDVLISDVDSVDAANVNDWTIVQSNIGAASETAAGYIQLATQAEMDTATNDTKAVTPLKYANSIIDGGTF